MALSKLCEQCSRIFAGTAPTSTSDESFIIHSSLATFWESIRASCHLCTILNSRWRSFLEATRPKAKTYRQHLEIHCRPGHQWQKLWFNLTSVDASQVIQPVIEAAATFELIPAADLDQAANRYVATPTTLSENSIIIAKAWYENCSTEHEYCSNGAPALSYFPRRALDVQSANPNTVKLMLNDNYSFMAPYLTLSHCWGKLKILKLESHNIQEFAAGIDIQRLPKTFREAIDVTRRLGFRYLWIDSLCIIQDSKEDWLRESTVMGKIYKHGALNIAATMASSGAEGMDYTKQPLLSEQLKIQATWRSLKGSEEQGFPPAGPYHLVESDLWMREIDRAPLNTRGWVLQERTMAPRILHFGRNQLFWQCGLDQSCEMYPRDYGDRRLGVGVSAYTESDLRPFIQVLAQVKQDPKSMDDWLVAKEVYAPWWTLVKMYSGMQLTKGEDKLIAIQAVAQTMQDVLPNDRYVAGFWESRLVEDLLWRVEPGIQDRPDIARPEEWRAPSWSWAAIDGPVTKAAMSGRYAGHKEFDGHVLVEDLRAEIDAIGADTGPLRGANLKLKGHLWWFKQPIKLRPVVQEQTGVASHLLVRLGGQDGATLNCWPDELDWNLETSFEMVMPGNTALLPIGNYDLTLNGKTSTTFEGLLVQDSRDGHFLRLGYFSLTCRIFEDLQESLSSRTNSRGAIDLGSPKTALVLL